MQCLLKNLYKEELSEYKKILGSEEAAYYVLAMNNGYDLKYTHEGKPSELYLALLLRGSNRKTAILEKSAIFTPYFINKYGNFTEGLYKGSLDNNGEPSIQDLNEGPLCDSSSVSSVLEDSGRVVKTLDILEKNNCLIRDFSIRDAINFNRDVFVRDGLDKFLKEHPDADPLSIVKEKSNLSIKWDNQTMDRLLNEQQKKLALYFDLELVVEDNGNFYYKTQDTSRKAKLRVQFVNSLRKGGWKDEEGNYHKGMFIDNDGKDAAINLIYVSLIDGDATTIVHELAHHYIRTFWDSEVIQNALNTFDELELIRRYKKSAVTLEEALAKYLTDSILLNDSKSWVSRFWVSFNKMVKENLGIDLLNYNQRQNILDQATMYFSINQDLQYNKAKQNIYEKFGNILFLDVYDESLVKNNTYMHLLRALNRKRNSLRAKILKDNYLISEIDFKIENLKKIDPQYKNQLLDSILDLYQEASEAILSVALELAAYDLNKNYLYKMNPKHLLEIKTDVIEYYAHIFGDKSISYFERLPGIREDKDLIDAFNSIRSDINNVARTYNIILENYVYNKIEEYADEFIDVGDKEVWKYNAKLWLHSLIDNGSLMLGENWLGIASLSKSPIIRLVEFLTQSVNNKVFTETLEVCHELTDIYQQAKPKNDYLTPANFMKIFCELDDNGQPTGYWKRKKNYGKMYIEKDRLMNKLLEKYDGLVDVTEEGEYIFKDDETRINFLNEKDDLEETIANKKYIALYYKDKRKFLSKEAVDAQAYIQRLIDILELKFKNSITGAPELHRLTQEERHQLDKLYKEKEDLASPYEILYDEQGGIRSLKQKSGIDLQIAQEIQNWRVHIADKVKYNLNKEKFDSDRKQLVKQYGEGSSAVQWFDWYYSSALIVPRFYELKNTIFLNRELPDEIKLLYRRKSIILNAVRDKKGYYQPHLERLNNEAWKELYRIEDEILRWFGKQEEQKDIEEIESISDKKYVMRYVNGKLTEQPFLFYLLSIYNEKDFMERFYVNIYDLDGEIVGIKPMSVFMYESPFETLTDAKGTFNPVLILPNGPYTELDPESYYANDKYDRTDPSYLQPKDLFLNESWDEIYGTNEDGTYKYPERVKFYESILKVMLKANSMIPNYIDTRSFRMPGMTETTSHLLFRLKGNFFMNLWKHFKTKMSTVSDRDVDYNEEIAKKPNGDPVYTIPLRWINKLEDPSSTSMDILGSVAAYYEMALNYKLKQDFAPLSELILSEMLGGIATIGKGSVSNGQIKRLKKYMEMYIYGKMRSGLTTSPEMKMTESLKRIATALDEIARRSYLKMMAHNWRGVIKNWMDAGMTTIVETAAGKYFTKEDIAFATQECAREVFGLISSIGTPINRSKVAAAMQYNKVSGRIYEMFSRQNETRLRRIISKNFAMGEYTFVDYSVKGWVTPAIYHNHRLLDNFDIRLVELGNGKRVYLSLRQAESLNVEDSWNLSTTYRKEFMNELLAITNYIRFGKTAEEGSEAWKKQKTTLWDAYDVDDVGNFVLKSNYIDIVRPINAITGVRSSKTEDRIHGVMRERFAVIAGMLPEENRSAFMLTYFGTFIFMLRGWLITFAWDCLKKGSDFATYVAKLSENKDATSDLYIKKSDDLEFFDEMFEFQTGLSGKGWLTGQHKLMWRVFMNGVNKLLNKIFKTHRQIKPLTKTHKWQVAKMSFYLLMAVFTVIGTHIFGRLLEDDPDNLFYNFGYSTSVALIPERTTLILPTSILDLIKNATAALSYLDDINNVFTVPYDFACTAYFIYNEIIDDPEFKANQDLVVKTGSYTGYTKEQRNLFKASSILFPALGINNIVKNTSVEAHKAYQNWLLQQSPVDILLKTGLVYKPNKNKTKDKKKSKSKFKLKKVE